MWRIYVGNRRNVNGFNLKPTASTTILSIETQSLKVPNLPSETMSLLKPMTNGCDESAFMRISRISLWNLQAKDDMFIFWIDDNPGPTSPASTSQQAFLYPNWLQYFQFIFECLIFLGPRTSERVSICFHGWMYSKERDLHLVRVHCHCIMNVQESTSPSKRQVLNLQCPLT